MAFSDSSSLTASTISALRLELAAAEFWKSDNEDQGFDSDSNWTMEGVSEGRCRFIGRNPPPFGPYRRLCQYMLELSRLRIKRLY